MTQQLQWLDPINHQFPDTRNALAEPNGLLAVGGDLSVPRLINAYSRGIFPWFSDGQPILWWTPSPRTVLIPKDIHINRSLRKLAKKRPFTITVDTAFADVINNCAKPRIVDGLPEENTWITQDIKTAYCNLHKAGYAHSIEAWQGTRLVGGLYGVSLGNVFFGESMFSHVSGASKMAFATLTTQLQQWGYSLIDCQIHSTHLASFGAIEISRDDFEKRLRANIPSNKLENQPPASHTYQTWQHQWTMPEFGFD